MIKNTFFLFNVASASKIATTSPTCQGSPQLSSGPRHSSLVLTTFNQILAQFMRLSKLELEPLLQPDLHLLDNVTAKRLGDLRQLDHRLHQQDNRANQNELSKLYGRKGANILSHQGFIRIHPRSEGTLSSGPSVLQRLRKGHRNCEHLFWGTHSVW